MKTWEEGRVPKKTMFIQEFPKKKGRINMLIKKDEKGSMRAFTEASASWPQIYDS